jgi:hypothetical protein
MGVVKQRKGVERVPINPYEVERRKQRIAEQRAYIESLKHEKPMSDGTMGMRVSNIDIDALEKQVEREEQALAYLAPKEGTPAEKAQAKKDHDEAAEYIRKNALTWNELRTFPKPGDHEKDQNYARAVEKSMQQEVGNPKFQEMCNKLKRAAAILDPNDPELRDINKYRDGGR